jgi:hypothetical protein
MKRILMTTAALFFTGHMAMAAIDPQALADSYVADGYTYVEVKQGPNQTKLEAIKGTVKTEVVYDNATGDIISQESQTASATDAAQTGVEIKTTTRDFEDNGKDHDKVGDDSEDDQSGSDDSDEDSHDGNDDNSGDDHGGGDHGGGDNGGGDSDGGDD